MESEEPFRQWLDWTQLWKDPGSGSGIAEAEAFIEELLGEDTTADFSEPLDEWVLCHRVNLHFYVVDGRPSTCLRCGRLSKPDRGQRRTDFLQRVLCPAGHDTHLRESSGLCNDCDTDIIVDISKRRQRCWDETCHRRLVVDQPLIEWGLQRVKAQKNVLTEYLELLQKHGTFDCIACCEAVRFEDSERCLKRPPTTLCKHDVNMCKTRFQGHLKSSIKPRQFRHVRCPSDKCNELLSTADVKLFATKEPFQQYEHAAFLNKISTDPNFRWCTNPSSTCQSGQLHPPGDSAPCWTCAKCGFRNCFTDKTPWHENETCEQHKLSKQFDGLSMQEINRRTKKCPNRGCGARIMKNGMCKDMHCKAMPGGQGGCGRTFCWECKIIYDVAVAACGDSQHLSSCKYKSDRRASLVAKPAASDTLYAKDWDTDVGYVPEEGETWRPQGT